MNVFNLSENDEDYVKSVMKTGVGLSQALAQLEVMKDENEFMRLLQSALSEKKIQEKIREVIR